jgi:hypothetical protein
MIVDAMRYLAQTVADQVGCLVWGPSVNGHQSIGKCSK